MPTLHWLNDEDARRAAQAVPYRLLEEDPALSYGDPLAQNLLIQGDNLAALKSLLPYYAGQVKCIFIDPPYNTGTAFEHYDDSVEHSTWLSMMYPRLELLRDLLRLDGSIWVSIDDNEGHYLKVMMDEIFGRGNFMDVEQLLGRVLRMPYARKRVQEELNRAYAHVSATSWPQAVSQLEDRLVSMGFEEQEAEEAIRPTPAHPQPGTPMLPGIEEAPSGEQPAGLGALAGLAQSVSLVLSAAPALIYLTADELGRVAVRTLGEGRVAFEVRGDVSPEFEQKLSEAVPPADRSALQRTLAVFRRQQPNTPAQRRESFVVPQLCLWADGQLERVQREWFLDPGGWNLLDFPAELSEGEFCIQEQAESFLIDINGRRLTTRYLGAQLPIDFQDVDAGWTVLQLSRWLDSKLYQPDIRQEVLMEWLRRTVAYLERQRGFSLTTLVRARFLLEKALREKLKSCREQAYTRGYQATMFGSQTRIETSYDYAFRYDPANYPAHWLYGGRYQFGKHYYRVVGELESSGEEFECAQAIDRCYQVKHWVRNLAQQPDFSFRLPLATGYFYPDFVAELKDGRILVVEYKGAHLQEYEQEKRNVGELWEEKSQGKALFLWAVERDSQSRDVYRQLENKLN